MDRAVINIKVKFLDDQKTYLGNQLESEFGGDRCFGILASMDFISVEKTPTSASGE